MHSSYEDFLKRFSQYKLCLNMTQAETSHLLGITQSQFSKMELGKIIVSYKSLKCLMKEGWDVDYLVTGKESVHGVSELTELLMEIDEREKRGVLNAVAWLLEQGITKCVSEISFETKCEIEVLKRRADGCETDSVLQEIRNISGISQIPMSEKLGVNIKKYRMLEKSKTNPDAELLLRIYEVTGCKPSLLIDFGNLEYVIIDDLWQQIAYPVQERILHLSKQILCFLKM